MGLKDAPELEPVQRNTLLYSLIIPAYNEEENILPTVREMAAALRAEGIPFELVIVNDHSRDHTEEVIREASTTFPEIRLVRNPLPGGLGRAVRCGLSHFSGEAVAIVMADLSDEPRDVVAYYRKLEEGYDCVFGSRFMKGSTVKDYPRVKLFVNRLVNHMLRVLFLTHHNDLTNAFKAYRRHVIESISPLRAAHFNITIEMSLSALIRRYSIAAIPINWYGRTWGSSNLRLKDMGRRYLATLLKVWFEWILIRDDLMLENRPRE
ncbi:MAG: glycosyltransferase family 2 protein [Candidatus Hydrogenedentes bacterium]|nr:glycosyltransferase family 2 protein [Candidatus Hydrogenedentota bacterium]